MSLVSGWAGRPWMAREPTYRRPAPREIMRRRGVESATNDTTYLLRLPPEEDVKCRFTDRSR